VWNKRCGGPVGRCQHFWTHPLFFLHPSVDYGAKWANFFTGGLSLQVEHHLFPNISFGHYPAIADIVADECAKRGVPYTRYPTLWEALVEYTRFMRDVGRA
jgi:acyl-lipid (7-3)-desaturase (Delta-4 desaturase)